MPPLISVIVPCYNEQESLPVFYQKIITIFSKMEQDYRVSFELLFVDDGSKDQTLSIMKMLASQDKRIHYLSFSRNFGKEAAIYAGFEHVTGDYVAIMDVDLQDPPELLIEMYNSIQNEGYDCVAARRNNRKGEPIIRSFFARCFYKLINLISRTEIVDGARDFRMMTRQMADAILEMKEYNRFSKGIFGWVGFQTKWLEYNNIERIAGNTKWSFWKLFLYSLDGIVAFSTTPLSIASVFGMLFLLAAFIFIVFIIVKTLIFGDPVAGYPSMMCVICMIGGLQLFSIGILGQYVSKLYLEIKHRPIYIVKETNLNTNFNSKRSI